MFMRANIMNRIVDNSDSLNETRDDRFTMQMEQTLIE